MFEMQARVTRKHCAAAALAAAFLSGSAAAQISGFSIPPWKINKGDPNNPGPVNPPISVTLTTQTAGQLRSLFYCEKQRVCSFKVNFTYQYTGSTPGNMGAAFVLHTNGNAGCAALTICTPLYGYGSTCGGTSFCCSSVGITLEAASLATGSSSTGVYQNGSVGGGSQSTSPVNLFSGNPIDVEFSFKGGLVARKFVDTVTGDTFVAPLVPFDIPAVLGGTDAWVGFTASTNQVSGTTQTFSNLEYSPGCYADCDCSGTLNFFDFLCFQNAFAGSETYADCDKSSTLDFFDFLCFQNQFAFGCP